MKKYIYYAKESWIDTLAGIRIPEGRIAFISDEKDNYCESPYIIMDLTDEQITNIDKYCVMDEQLVEDTTVYDYLHKNKMVSEQSQTIQRIQQRTMLLTLSDEEAYAVRYLYGEYSVGVDYKTGDRFIFEDKFYKVNQDHTSSSEWRPDNSFSLYTEIPDPAEEWPEFKKPQGAHDAYTKGDKITFEGKHYVSKADNNIYSPKEYPDNWELVE